MEREVADVRITINVKHMYIVISTVVAVTVAAAMGWFTLKADVAEAKKMAESLKTEVSEIRCLVKQQNEYQIYKKIPVYSCGG